MGVQPHMEQRPLHRTSLSMLLDWGGAVLDAEVRALLLVRTPLDNGPVVLRARVRIESRQAFGNRTGERPRFRAFSRDCALARRLLCFAVPRIAAVARVTTCTLRVVAADLA